MNMHICSHAAAELALQPSILSVFRWFVQQLPLVLQAQTAKHANVLLALLWSTLKDCPFAAFWSLGFLLSPGNESWRSDLQQQLWSLSKRQQLMEVATDRSLLLSACAQEAYRLRAPSMYPPGARYAYALPMLGRVVIAISFFLSFFLAVPRVPTLSCHTLRQ